MRAARIAAVLLCASALALAAGCGGGGGTKSAGTKPNTWAASVCGALREWTQTLLADSQKITTPGAKSTQVVKTRFAAFLQASVRNADTMIAKVESAGAPAVTDGPKLQADLLAGLRKTRQSFENAIPKAKALSATDRKAFSAGATGISREVNSELVAVGRDFKRLGTKYNAKDLNNATSSEPSCGKLLG